MVDDRSLHPALAYALALDDAVGRGEVNRPTLLIGKRFQLRAEQRHHVVARRNDIRFRSPRRRDAAAELGGSKQQAGTPEPQPADHPQAGCIFRPDTRERPPQAASNAPAVCSSSVSTASNSASLRDSTPLAVILSVIVFIGKISGRKSGLYRAVCGKVIGHKIEPHIVSIRPAQGISRAFRRHRIITESYCVSRSTLSSSDAHCSSVMYSATENAACCSASFFDSPEPCPTSMPSTSTVE